MRFVLLCVLCLGCASGAPTTYNQAAFRPAPPVFVPSQDAPHTIGQPGHLAPASPKYPKSPHKRPLPPTREPGIWAGDGPKAVATRPPEPMIQGVAIPLPDDVDEKDLGHARKCEATVNEILSVRDRALGKELADMFFDYRKCAAFRAWAYCMNIHFGPEPKDQRSRDLADAIESALAPFCGDRKTPDFNRDFRGAIEAWAKATLRRSP